VYDGTRIFIHYQMNSEIGEKGNLEERSRRKGVGRTEEKMARTRGRLQSRNSSLQDNDKDFRLLRRVPYKKTKTKTFDGTERSLTTNRGPEEV